MADGDKVNFEVEETEVGERPKSPPSDPEELRKVGEETVEEVLSLAQAADQLKEHDALQEEQTEAARVQAQLQKELEENDGWVKIIGNDELVKKVIKAGQSNHRPMRGDVCLIRFHGSLAADESVVFEREEEFHFQLGDAEVTTGLDLSIPLMEKGEVALLKVASRFGYGKKGLPPMVPENADLVYEVELIDFDSEKDLVELSVKERREIGNRKRERGNWWYGRREDSLAVQSYRRALEFLDEAEGGIQFPDDNADKNKIDPELKELFEDRLKTLNNMAAAQMRLSAFEPALHSVESVLKCQPFNVKALFRKGKILGAKGETEQALKVLQYVKTLDPTNRAIDVEIKMLSERRKAEHHTEKNLYKRMFDSPRESVDKDSKGSKGEGDNNGGGGLRSSLSVGLVLSGVAIAVAGVMAYRYRF